MNLCGAHVRQQAALPAVAAVAVREALEAARFVVWLRRPERCHMPAFCSASVWTTPLSWLAVYLQSTLPDQPCILLCLRRQSGHWDLFLETNHRTDSHLTLDQPWVRLLFLQAGDQAFDRQGLGDLVIRCAQRTSRRVG